MSPVGHQIYQQFIVVDSIGNEEIPNVDVLRALAGFSVLL
jgi:hypothetical protein